MKQKFSDRFLPRKVSKQEIRAKKLEGKAQSIYKIIMEDFTKFCAKHDKEYSFKECFMLFKTQNYRTVKLLHGGLGIRVLEVMEEQVNNANHDELKHKMYLESQDAVRKLNPLNL